MKKAARKKFRFETFDSNPYCHWCDERMILKPEPDEVEDMATIEHLIPISKGGPDKEWNLRLSHKRCNR